MGELHASHGSGTPGSGEAGAGCPQPLERPRRGVGTRPCCWTGAWSCSGRPWPATAVRARVHVDATLGLGGHAEAVLAAHPTCAWSGSTAIPARWPGPGSGSRPYADRIQLEHAVYDELPEVLDRLGLDTVDSVLFDLGRLVACSSTRPSARLRVRPGRAAGHADGPGHRLTAERGRQHLPGRRPGPGAAGVRRGAVRLPDRGRDRAGAGPGADHLLGRAWPSWSATPSRRRPGAPVGTRPSGRSRRCGSRSTASWPRWRPPCRPPSTRSPSAAGSSCWPTSRWRTGIVKRALAARATSHRAGRPAGRAARHRADAAPADPRRRAGRRGRGGGQPAGRLGPAARRRADRSRRDSTGHATARRTGTGRTSRTAAGHRGPQSRLGGTETTNEGEGR